MWTSRLDGGNKRIVIIQEVFIIPAAHILSPPFPLVHGYQFSSVQSLSRVWLFVTPWTAACQASLSITNSQSPPNPMSIELVLTFNHLILCCPLLLHLQSFPASGSFTMSWFFASGDQSIRVSSSASVLPMNIQSWFPFRWTGWDFMKVSTGRHDQLLTVSSLFLFSGGRMPGWKFQASNHSLRTTVGSLKRQESPRETSISALLTMPKLLTVWITTNGKILKEMGIPDHLTCLLRNRYAGQEAGVRTGHGTDWFQIGKGVLQGCI